MERPKITTELVRRAAEAFCKSHGWDWPSATTELTRAYNSHRGNPDGYELAKTLDDIHGWDVDAATVEELDCFYSEVMDAHRSACVAWVRDNNIQPPHPIGTVITRGEITGICTHTPATYLVRAPGDTNPNHRLLIPFECATPLAQQANGGERHG